MQSNARQKEGILSREQRDALLQMGEKSGCQAAEFRPPHHIEWFAPGQFRRDGVAIAAIRGVGDRSAGAPAVTWPDDFCTWHVWGQPCAGRICRQRFLEVLPAPCSGLNRLAGRRCRKLRSAVRSAPRPSAERRDASGCRPHGDAFTDAATRLTVRTERIVRTQWNRKWPGAGSRRCAMTILGSPAPWVCQPRLERN